MEKSEAAPAPAPMNVAGERGEEKRRNFDNSVSAVSFGFVATAILISMFLVMAIFERFLRLRSAVLSPDEDAARRVRGPDGDLEAQQPRGFIAIDDPSPKMSLYSKGVSVLMPGRLSLLILLLILACLNGIHGPLISRVQPVALNSVQARC